MTTILVTHDQEEAMDVADQIVVMNHARVEQTGAPARDLRPPRERVRDGLRRPGRRRWATSSCARTTSISRSSPPTTTARRWSAHRAPRLRGARRAPARRRLARIRADHARSGRAARARAQPDRLHPPAPHPQLRRGGLTRGQRSGCRPGPRFHLGSEPAALREPALHRADAGNLGVVAGVLLAQPGDGGEDAIAAGEACSRLASEARPGVGARPGARDGVPSARTA